MSSGVPLKLCLGPIVNCAAWPLAVTEKICSALVSKVCNVPTETRRRPDGVPTGPGPGPGPGPLTRAEKRSSRASSVSCTEPRSTRREKSTCRTRFRCRVVDRVPEEKEHGSADMMRVR
ncbi:hypothetical protein EYF80_062360 [Liparis tanakae]|uniref:Uncharacterized protein n=1 Tax=Liparis tanakae TaxID=230148 RepID=A0A4Z2EFH8_9TELE|nr:hypothetical protein EYF80_062360 [Liparis tanakae]